MSQGEQGEDGRLVRAWCEIPRLLLLCIQRQMPTDCASQIQSKDESPTKRAYGSEQWMGICQAEAKARGVYMRMGGLLSSCKYEATAPCNGQMATLTNTHVYMEVLEESQDEDCQPCKVWYRQVPSLYVGQQPSWILACSRQSYFDEGYQ